MEQSTGSLLASFFPLIIISIPIVFFARILAKEKGRNIKLWTILGVIPLVNMACLWYFVGAANLRLEQKIDNLTEMIRNN